MKALHNTGFKFNAFCICAALITYTSMYAFRKPLSAATFEGIVYWGVDYKVIALISQVIGYTCSKFLGIKIVSGMKPTQRIAYILSLVGIAWVSLLLFALVPAPTNIIFLLTNGLPLGMIFGIVISFLEGRKNTELLGADLCVSFITASGITKAVGKFLILHLGISDFWMPFLVGLLFVPLLLLGVWMLGKIPPPSAEDTALRGKRQPMSLTQRVAFFHQFAWGVILSTLVYATLTVYRDLRDNFTVEIWEFFGLGDNVSILAISEICIAIIVLIVIASMIKVVNNRKAFFYNISAFIGGGITLFLTTWLNARGLISPITWMITSGFGLYLCYACFHPMFFERWMALFKYQGNIGFLICVSDSFGYLGSVGVLLYKNFMSPGTDWLPFIQTTAYVAGCLIAGLSILLYFYFQYKTQPAKEPKRKMIFLPSWKFLTCKYHIEQNISQNKSN